MEINIPGDLGGAVHHLLHLRKPCCWSETKPGRKDSFVGRREFV